MKVQVEVGVGAYGFVTECEFAHVPNVGEEIAAHGDAQVYTVKSKIVTPTRVYLRCYHPFPGVDEARKAKGEWS